MSVHEETITPIHDVVIIGAGPCGLAVAARMREDTPSALFTEFEHQRWHWANKHAKRQARLKTKGRAGNMVVVDDSETRRGSHSSSNHDHHMHANDYSIQVFDSTGSKWMGKWNSLFSAFDIKTLRSPMFFHPGPEDRDGLKAFAYIKGREDEMTELKNICGKEISKHHKKKALKRNIKKDEPRGKAIDERDKQDYFTPSTALFDDYCKDCVSRYRLDRLVDQTDVKSVRFDEMADADRPDECFTITTSTGKHYARAVVMATGPGTPNIIPLSSEESEGACHTSKLTSMGALAPHVARKVTSKRSTNVIVVGGGLTSAQIAHLTIKKGVSKVFHIMRSEYKEKNFDLELSWLAKYKNVNLATYWGLQNEEERIEMMQAARNGGSITPAYNQVLKQLMNKGQMDRHTKTIITEKKWNAEMKTWDITTSPKINNLPPIDYIYYATGAAVDFKNLPLIQPLLNEYPIEIESGFPCITNELQWNEKVPFFIAGRYASLRLGPGAANLEGARTGAERIASRIQEILEEREDAGYGGSDHDEALDDGRRLRELQRQYARGGSHVNMYDALDDGDEE